MRINKIACFIVAAFLVVLCGLLMTNQAAVAKQLDDWKVLPQPTRFSELYFADEHQLPSTVKVGSLQKLSFSIHNLEHRTTNYTYKIFATSSANGVEQLLAQGVLSLDHDRTQVTDQTVEVPAIDARLAIKINIEYESIAMGETQPRPQTQSIFYWVKTENGVALGRGSHDA